MISRSVYSTDARVRREAQALVDAGHQVTFVGTGDDDHNHAPVRVHGVGLVSGLRRGTASRSGAFYRAARWLLLPNHRHSAIREFRVAVGMRFETEGWQPDVVHAHDYPALAVADEIATNTGAMLVYDAHELWAGMPRPGRPSLERRRILREEARLAGHAVAVFTVSEGAARTLKGWHRLGNVIVVRNTFPTRTSLNPSRSPKGLVYAGRIARGRDLETVFTALQRHTSLPLVLIGPGDDSLAVPSNVTVLANAPLETVDRLLVDTGIALVTLTQGPLNHEVALPNKLFEAVSVGVPVVAADLPEIRSLVTKHDIGTLYQPGSPDSLAHAIDTITREYPKFLHNVKAAQPALDWSVDKTRLLEAYESFRHHKPGT